MVNLAAGTSVNGHTQNVQSSLYWLRSSLRRPDMLSLLRTGELRSPYGIFEGSLHEVAPTKTKKKVAFAKDERSNSSRSTIVSGEFEA